MIFMVTHAIEFNEIELGRDIEQAALRGLAGATTVPQVFIGGKLIGGAVELKSYLGASKI